MENKMRISLVQYSPKWEDKEKNSGKINEIIQKTNLDTNVLIFPEMTLTGFTMSSEENAEEIDGFSVDYFMNLSRKLKIDIFAGIIEKDENTIFNSIFHFDKNGILAARYRKIHPFSYAKEEQNYSAGFEPVVTKIGKTKIGLSVCYDLRFPELYRKYAKEKVDLIVNIANWPVKRIEHWKALLKARAIENQCFMIGVNRVGTDPFNEYNGFSSIIDPMGNIIIENENEEKILTAEIDLDIVRQTREKLPFLQDIKMI